MLERALGVRFPSTMPWAYDGEIGSFRASARHFSRPRPVSNRRRAGMEAAIDCAVPDGLDMVSAVELVGGGGLIVRLLT